MPIFVWLLNNCKVCIFSAGSALFHDEAHERCDGIDAIGCLWPSSLGRMALSSEPKAVKARYSYKGRASLDQDGSM